jgi:hypothetical protein
MTGYDPNYTPDEDPLDDVEVLGTPIKDVGNFLGIGCLIVLGLGVALFVVIGLAFVCHEPGGFC